MIKPRRRPDWPFGVDNAAARAMVVAHYCWAALAEVDPQRAEQVRIFFRQWDEGVYLAPTWTSTGPRMTRQDVADLAQVAPTVVTMWATRGIVRAGQRHVLTRRADGDYDTDEVLAFLQLRDTTTEPAESTR